MEKSYLNHLPSTKVQLRACTLVFWKNLNKNIEEMTKWCSILQKFPKQAREPLISIQTEVPLRPRHTVGTDAFYLILLIADNETKYQFVNTMNL